MNKKADPASFRDPNGRVFVDSDQVLRGLSKRGAEKFRAVEATGLFRELVDAGLLLPFREITPALPLFVNGEPAATTLTQQLIPFISYPYEWSFALLKQAALLHLKVQLLALERGVTLSDASAFNIQFIGARPVFIDITSFQPAGDGEYWTGHQQFLNEFLNPLLLTALTGAYFAPWYRGTLSGISSIDLNRLVPTRRKLSWRFLSQVGFPAHFQKQNIKTGSTPSSTARRPFSRSAYRAILLDLERWIKTLTPRGFDASLWAYYEGQNTYSAAENERKRALVAELVAQHRPDTVWDVGCNQGEFSVVALLAGAQRVIGFDADETVLNLAYERARDGGLDFLPLYLDAANPSTDQGWMQTERKGLEQRRNADFLLALAIVHHLIVGRTIPVQSAVSWLVGLAPSGLIEFVSKDDPTLKRMLANREDIFDDYHEHAFEAAIAKCAEITGVHRLEGGTRILFSYKRRDH